MSDAFPPPDHPWWRNAVIYQIYPRSFKDANGDGVGDLEGIIEKLDYLNDGTENSLGIDAIWISPIYKSPMVDFGYDVLDHCDIDPLFGDMAVFDRLIEEAHKRGIKVLMDFIPNHTSSRHPWFLESRETRDNSKRNWYVWRDPKPDGSPPNNWVSVFGGPAWTFDEKTGQYYLHSFLPEQPDLDWMNQEVRHAMYGVIRFWLDRGVDGFRIDAIQHIGKDSEGADDPPNPAYDSAIHDPYDQYIHTNSRNTEDLEMYIDKMCGILREYEGVFSITEATYEMDFPEYLEMYRDIWRISGGTMIPFNFYFFRLPWMANAFRSFVYSFDSALQSGSIPNYVIGNHDRSRVASRRGPEKARLLAVLTMTLRGIGFIYYGDELGMTDTPIPQDKVQDPFEKRMHGKGSGRDPARTPMQWNASEYGGFSDAQPWLPLHPDCGTINVEVQSRDPNSMLNLYRRLIRLRKTELALISGSYHPIATNYPDVFTFIREQGSEKIMVVIHFGDETHAVVHPIKQAHLGFKLGRFLHAELIMSTRDINPSTKVYADITNLEVEPYHAYIFKLTNAQAPVPEPALEFPVAHQESEALPQ